MKLIIHVTEALGTGVAHSTSQLARAQVASGYEVLLIHSIRPETPSPEQMEKLFPAPIRRICLPMVNSVSPLQDLRHAMALARLFRQLDPAVIHLHSSKAGILGRVAALLSGHGRRVFYSPRGFAFLREDVSGFRRDLYLLFERFAAFLPGVLIGCSGTEATLARDRVRHPRVVLIENSADFSDIRPAAANGSSRLKVVTSGRLCYQKAPWKFRELAVGINDASIEFLWIGGGELAGELNGSACSSPIASTGWRDRQSVMDELSRADIFVMTSLWEGMPLSLIEAQATGLPAVVPDIVGCRDIVLHGETGFICSSETQMIESLRKLITDEDLRRSMGQAARKMALRRFSVQRMHSEMMREYGLPAGDQDAPRAA